MRFKPKYFDPLAAEGGTELDDKGTVSVRVAGRPQDSYVYTPKTVLAINVALATKRPLLIAGEPGSGKSTLARSAASVLGWWYYKRMITSRTQASDLLWTFDALRRLSDASMEGSLRSKYHYVDPGALWWSFSPGTAKLRGAAMLEEGDYAVDPGEPPPAGDGAKAVVLLDEVDKADPDVPNDLLEPFDLRTFTVRETNTEVVADRDTLLILTTNGERELPPAFLRRCVTLTLDPPTSEWFVSIADEKRGENQHDLHVEVADEVMALRGAAKKAGLREPSAGEYLDALAVCVELDLTTKSEAWKAVTKNVLWKHDRKLDKLMTQDRDDGE